MIARLWHGYTNRTNAPIYEKMLLGDILPGIRKLQGYRGCYVLQRKNGAEVEFITLTLWESIDAVRQFAGLDYTKAVIAPQAEILLTRYDAESVHYECVHSD
jgi:heme-degrading monooxygenase HmoA